MRIPLLILLVFPALAAVAADRVPAFNAVLSVGQQHRFVLISPTGNASNWLRLGDTFDGYTLKDYDSKDSSLGLLADGKITRVTLVADATAGDAATVPTPATLADAEVVMSVMRYEDLMKRMLARWFETNEREFFLQIDEKLRVLGVTRPERLAVFHQKVFDEIRSLVSDPETLGAMADAYIEAFSKEELKRLAEFYASPLGRVMIDKMPELDQALGRSLAPRLKLLRTKMEGMAAAFATEEATKTEITGSAAKPATTETRGSDIAPASRESMKREGK